MTNQNAADKASADAANLLLRLGLGVAFVAAPLALLMSQRSIFILAPIAGALTFAAGLVLAPRMRMREVFAPLFTPSGWRRFFWPSGRWLRCCGRLSRRGRAAPGQDPVHFPVAWCPVAAALPARSKAANLYLLPLGVVLAAFASIFLDARLSRGG